MMPLLGQLGPLGRAFNNVINYLLLDRFNTDQVAPLGATRTAEPGPGSWNITDPANNLSVVAGQLVLSAGGTPRIVSSTGLARAVGKAMLVDINASAVGIRAGWASSGTIDNRAHQILLNLVGANGFFVYASPSVSFQSSDKSTALNTVYNLAVVLRGTGAFFFVQGGTYTSWTLLWVDNTGVNATCYPILAAHTATGAGSFDNARVVDLATLDSRFASDYALASSRLISPAAGATFSHAADLLLDFTVTTLPTSGNAGIKFRVQDANNLWQCLITSAGALVLNENVAGVATQRATAAGAVAAGQRVVVVADGAVIKGYSNNTLRWTYSAATNFQTATSGIFSGAGTGGAISECVSWPRYVSAFSGV